MIEPLQALLIRMLLNEIKKYAFFKDLKRALCHFFLLKINVFVTD